MDERPRYVTVRYGGVFDGCNYIGGSAEVLPIFGETYLNLIYAINHILLENSLTITYGLFYVTNSTRGRALRKNRISNDQNVLELYESQSHPHVFVDHDDIDVYVPSFDLTQSSGYRYGYGYNAQSTEFDEGLEAIQRYASLSMPGVDELDYGRQNTFNLDQQEPDVPAFSEYSNRYTGEWPRWEDEQETVVPPPSSYNNHERWEYEQDTTLPAPDNDELEDEYVHTSDAETEASASEDLSDRENIKFTSAEFAGWIRREGGLGRVLSLINLGRLEDEEECIPDPTELTNWLVPVIPLDATASLVDHEHYTGRTTELSSNSYYNSKCDLIIAVGLWNMKQSAESAVLKSDNTRVYFKCKHSDKCPFQLRASSRDGSVWGVYKFIAEHTCHSEMGRVMRIKAHARVVAAYLALKMREDTEIMKPKSIILELRREYGIHIKYDVARRARNQAIELIYGKHDQSFDLLPKYLYLLRQSNPGSLVEWEVGPNGRFQHLFISLGASAGPFLFALRPVIVIDGTHLKERNKGILFVAVTKDGNESVFPLAYGVGPKENDESWKWFLSQIRRVFGQAKPLLVVSDQHISIANAVRSELPNATHGLCYYHLQNNIKHYGKPVVELYRQAAYAYKKSVFTQAMNAMKILKVEAYNKLMELGPEKWARSMCEVRRYSFLTSNAAETFNGRLLWARRLPICSMLEAIRLVIEKWFSERLTAAQRSNSHLTDEAQRRIALEVQKSRRYSVVRIGERKYKVRAGDRSLKVNLQEKKCKCRVFNRDVIPCSHAVAAISEAGEEIANYVDDYYTREFLIETYSGAVNHLPPREQWVVPEYIAEARVLPPKVIRQVGRPRENRYRSGGENATTSRNNTQDVDASSSRQRAPKRCSVCGQTGHTRRTCAGRAVENEHEN